MTLKQNRNAVANRSRGRFVAKPLAPVIGLVALAGVMLLGWSWAVRADRVPATAPPSTGSRPENAVVGQEHAVSAADSSLLRGYPPPATPTVTPEPDHGGVFPPPLISHQVVLRRASPYADRINNLEAALAGKAGTAFQGWIDGAGAGLPLEYAGATEGFGARLSPLATGSMLEALFAAGSQPVVQGYFETPGCRGGQGDRMCWPTFVTTGWQGPVPMPTKHPAESLGPPTPADVPIGAAAWEITSEATGPYWMAWWLGDGYHDLLGRLIAEGHTTYFVLR
jgi:hypothetical protein